jgi:hypothetical protein
MSVRTGRTLAAVVGLAAVAGMVVAAAPASAGTGVTFTLTGGSLSIAQPSATATITGVTSTALGTTSTGSLGSTTVTDTRASTAGWAVSMSSTDLSDGATHTIVAGKMVAYLSAVPTATSGTAVVTTTKLSAVTGLTLANTAGSLMTATTVGSNVVSFNPTVQLTVDSTDIAGTYTGTVTQTVA